MSEIISYSQMPLSKLFELKRTWEAQINVKLKEGSYNVAKKLVDKLAILDAHLDSRRNENLNDLFM